MKNAPLTEGHRERFRQIAAAAMVAFDSAKQHHKRTGAKRGALNCPICAKAIGWCLVGKNNHIRLACETPGCIQLME